MKKVLSYIINVLRWLLLMHDSVSPKKPDIDIDDDAIPKKK